jgi:hypothetical protein
MSCLGVHFALTAEEVDSLRAFDSEVERLGHLQEVIEEEYMDRELAEPLYAESDKAWDAIHRSLTDGSLTWDGGTYPLNHAVLAGELLYTGSNYIMSLKTPQQVKDIARSLESISPDDFRTKYFAIDSSEYGFSLTDEDLEYSWEWFQNVRDLYSRAAKLDRYVLFTADQ